MTDFYGSPRSRDKKSLLALLEILRCPITKEPLFYEIKGDGHVLVSKSGKTWNCLNFVPVLVDSVNVAIHSNDHYSNPLNEKARELIENTRGLVLNLSAGGSQIWRPNVIELEAAVFRNTDIVGDAHNLPFKDAIFDLCIAMNAFEHYSSPHLAAAEIRRVLKPGGVVLIHTAFLQPLHEAPFHFYNATQYGVRKWFEDFKEVSISTSSNFNPLFSVSWILSDLMNGLNDAGRKDDAQYLSTVTLGSISSFWGNKSMVPSRVLDIFNDLPPELMTSIAAGVEYVGTK